MKKLLLLFVLIGLYSCSADDENNAGMLPAQSMSNVSYGSDDEQKYDIDLPERSGNTTPVLILIHGGGWSGGSKSDMAGAVAGARLQFPNYAIVNMGYRLGTVESPAYPKQLEDIQMVIDHLESQPYGIAQRYGFVGVSAGAHLSMLYAYRFDSDRKVKAVASLVGPTDFTDPAYTGVGVELSMFPYLAGENPSNELIAEVSPALQVSSGDAPTIQFMGLQDPLVPVTQGERLKTRLDAANVTNELYFYEAGHGNFSITDAQDINAKLGNFFRARL